MNLQGFPNFQNTPVTYRYSLETQYNLGRSWVASVGYQGSQSRNYSIQLPLHLVNFANRNPRVNALAWFTNAASANYNALLTQVQHRFSKSFTLDFQYRYSRTRDQGAYSDDVNMLFRGDVNNF